jgi:hypothetical protein
MHRQKTIMSNRARRDRQRLRVIAQLRASRETISRKVKPRVNVSCADASAREARKRQLRKSLQRATLAVGRCRARAAFRCSTQHDDLRLASSASASIHGQVRDLLRRTSSTTTVVAGKRVLLLLAFVAFACAGARVSSQWLHRNTRMGLCSRFIWDFIIKFALRLVDCW